MPDVCELCGTEFDPRDKVCKVCGKKAGEAIAPEAVGVNAVAPPSAPAGLASNPYLIMPTLPQAQSRKRQRVAWMIGGGFTAVALLGAAGWIISALWRIGPGGEIAFKQHNRAGNAAFERGDFTTANAEYSEMIALRPRHVDGYVLRAINDYKQGRYPQAIRDNTSALAFTSSPMQRGALYYNRAEAYSNRRNWKEAVADYTASEQAYRQSNTEAGGYAQDQERLPRWLADARRGRARASLQLKNYAQTVADYSANIKAGNIFPEDYGMRATAEEGLGQEAEAIADYGKAICVDAGYLYGYQNLDRVVVRSHRYAQAVTAFRQATEAHPDSYLCWGSLGCFEHKVGHFSAAIAADERALSLDPNQDWIRYNQGLSYAVAGDSVRASKAYAAALAGQNQPRRTEALQEIQKELVQHPGSTALQAARKQLETALASNPDTSPATTTRSAALPAPHVAPAFESLLAADTTQHGYAIRPPAGYTLKHSEGVTLSGNQVVDYWRGAVRPDGSAPDLQVNLITDDGRMAAQSSPRQRMQQYLDSLAGNHTHFKVSAITPFTLGMRTFLKATWSGIGTKTGREFHGVAYIASQTGEYISLFVHDSAPYSATSLPLLEASARTFRR